MPKKITVLPHGGRPTAPRARRRRVLTPIWPPTKRPTFIAVVKDAGGRSRPENWDVFSRDGLWHYQRQDDGCRTPWLIIFRPTGQITGEFGTLAASRHETAQPRLLPKLRSEAFTGALRTPVDDPDRADAHRWLAVHMRLQKMGASEALHRCVCGGYLAPVTRAGDVAHLDACPSCYRPGRGLPEGQCPRAARHRFCGDPLVAGIAAGCGLYRFDCCDAGACHSGDS